MSASVRPLQPVLLTLVVVLAGFFAGCSTLENRQIKPALPLPPQMVKDYEGYSQSALLYRLGEPDLKGTTTQGQTYWLYHWHTRDAVDAPRMESTWRGNTAFTQRQLPTSNVPLREACDMMFVMSGDLVARVEPKGQCW